MQVVRLVEDETLTESMREKECNSSGLVLAAAWRSSTDESLWESNLRQQYEPLSPVTIPNKETEWQNERERESENE